MLTGGPLKEHILNRLGFGMGTWHFDRYDQLGGMAGYVAEQSNDTLPSNASLNITDGTTIGTKLQREVFTRRQMETALTDFWFNHFNVSTASVVPAQRDNTIRGRTCDHYQNVAIRPYVFGDFGSMLLETARAPAMLDYLDNRVNFAGSTNDNYAREVMELHTVGINGGYNEVDITEVSRIMTGWRVVADEYFYDNSRHDHGDKTVMGVSWPQTFNDPALGEQQGIDFLGWLADHPSTPGFLANKLVMRLVNENAPAGAVSAAVAGYGANRDLNAMTFAVINHPDFLDPANFRSKIKSPSRYMASALQAMGATDPAQWSGMGIGTAIQDAGEVPYVCEPPTGWPEDSAFWSSGTGFIDRFGIANAMAYRPELVTALTARLNNLGLFPNDDVETIVNGVAAIFVPGGLSPESELAALDHVAVNAMSASERISAAAHVIMCSPEFIRF